jgi:hypothetical protein
MSYTGEKLTASIHIKLEPTLKKCLKKLAVDEDETLSGICRRLILEYVR